MSGGLNPFFIRVIREIRGSNCCFWADSLSVRWRLVVSDVGRYDFFLNPPPSHSRKDFPPGLEHTGIIQSSQKLRAPPPTVPIVLHRLRSSPTTNGEYLRVTSDGQTEVPRRCYGGTLWKGS